MHHEPDSTTCGCGCQLKRIGEDVSEKLDYTPGVMTVERHIHGKWICTQCETLIQAPVPAEIIDKGIPTSGLLAQVLVAKYSDHLPLYRQETDWTSPAFVGIFQLTVRCHLSVDLRTTSTVLDDRDYGFFERQLLGVEFD